MKNTKISETTSLQLRIDIFNLFNKANFADPSGGLVQGDNNTLIPTAFLVRVSRLSVISLADCSVSADRDRYNCRQDLISNYFFSDFHEGRMRLQKGFRPATILSIIILRP